MPVPFSFGAATTAIPLSQLDSNFNTPITLGNTAIQLGNTVTTLNNMTLANVTISSGNVTITNVTVTTANATTVNTTTLIATTANVTTGNVTNLISGNVTLTGGSITGTTISGSTGSFTTLTTSSTVTLNCGTANGVAYLNGSKVLTTGSALTFDGTGKLGVGTTTPVSGVSAGFEAVGEIWATTASSNANQIRLSPSTSGANIIYSTYSGAGSYLPLAFNVSGSEQMRLTSTGLGIGTSSPGYKLTVQGSANNENIVNIRNAAGTVDGDTTNLIRFTANGNVLWANARYDAFAHIWHGNASERMRLDSSGNLGLGVTPSAWSGFRALQVGGATSIWSSTSGAGSSFYSNNVYFDGSNRRRINAGFATEYIQDSSGGAHIWYNAASSTAGSTITFTQAMTLDASGNLGVGTTSPANRVQSRRDATTDAANSQFVSENRTGASGQYALYATRFDNGSGSGFTPVAFGAVQTAAAGRTGAFIIAVSDTDNVNLSTHERARITSGGDFVVGDTSTIASARMSVVGNVADMLVRLKNENTTAPSGLDVHYSGAATNNTSNWFYLGRDSGANRFYVYSNGGIANYQANDANLSDRREKTNFAPAKSYLDTICAIPVQTFNYIDQSENDPGLTLGVVAQDVQAVAPELVMESNWGTEDNPKMRLSVYQTDLQYALMKALQELKSELDSVKAELATLKGA